MVATAERRREIVLPPLHDGQREIAKHAARFKVVCCGRRWGKTMLGIVCCLAGPPGKRGALRGGRIWWIAPTYKQALEGWTYLLRVVGQIPNTGVSVSELKVTFEGGGSIQVRTADDPNNLRGAGLDGAVLDEAAYIKAECWELVLRPALADHQGWAMFISTPQHFNWFYDLYTRGEDPAESDWASWQHPTWDNPFIPEAEIEAARREMAGRPEDFDQEFGASFTAIGGAVFRALGGNRPMYLRPLPAGLEFRRRGIGMDWGTTPQHEAAVVAGGLLSTGAVWILSAWLDHSGSDEVWFDEAMRCRRDYGCSFARVDRSQSSARGRLKAMGYEADVGLANVEARNGAYAGLINAKALFFDAAGPGVRELFDHLAAYHRDRDGKIVEEQDDDVDAGGYLVAELTKGDHSLFSGGPRVTQLRTPPFGRRPEAQARKEAWV